MSEEQLFFNGINGGTGEYLLPPLTLEQVSQIAQGKEVDEDQAYLEELKDKESTSARAPIEGVEPNNLAETGWGVIFAAYPKDDLDAKKKQDAIKEALSELLEHRKKQATRKYKEYIGPTGYRPGESKNQFLARHRAGPGPVDPEKVPFYLLIVGNPETIPYRFQYQLDVQYAVGRIYFDTLQEYAQYARSVVEVETGQRSLPRRASFFGVRNNGDQATQLSADHLVKPLAKLMAKDQPDWTVQTILKDEATKARLSQLLGGTETPALLFTASHGLGFNSDDPRQLSHQGALLCQDWPGPLQGKGAVDVNHYFSADDIGNDAQLLGLISFHFACYGAGTPKMDEFAKDPLKRSAIAPHAFVARLPQRLLGHPKGGALAAIGHVERAWGCSFVWERAGEQLGVFQSTLKRLMEGHTVGSALDFFNVRYAELSVGLSSELEEIKYGATVNNSILAGMWTANNDARSYALVGDPAVRLVVGNNEAAAERSTIEPYQAG